MKADNIALMVLLFVVLLLIGLSVYHHGRAVGRLEMAREIYANEITEGY